MLGGGIFVTQNKTLPGAYVNFVNAQRANSTMGERGVVAIALSLSVSPGNVIEVTQNDFVANAETLLGAKYTDDKMKPLREIFLHANKVYVYDNAESNDDVTATISALEPYEFNVLCAYTNVSEDITAYITAVKGWRDTLGKKCQLVVYNTASTDNEGVINVVSTVSDDGADAYALTAWVAGAEAGCAINSSCTNMIYDGEHTVVTNKTQTQLENCLKNGEFVFHMVYGNVRVLEDINSFTTVTTDKGEDFKYNQTIRVIDQIANDIAKLFNTKYLGKIPNNSSGRLSLWGDIIAHHRQLETAQAIENFDANLVTVEQGANKKSVVVNDAITVTNAMSTLYMTIVVQ